MDDDKEDTKQPRKTLPVPQLEQNQSDFALAMALQEQEREQDMAFTHQSDDSTSNDDEEEDEDSELSYDDEDYEFFDSSEIQGELEFLEGNTDMEYIDELEEEDEIDPDDLSYEELLALGEVVGKENIGLSQDEVMACLRLCPWKIGGSSIVESKGGIVDCCVICQMEYEDGEDLVALVACEHPYHFDCINKWLLIKKTCPICNCDVSPPSTDMILTSATN